MVVLAEKSLWQRSWVGLSWVGLGWPGMGWVGGRRAIPSWCDHGSFVYPCFAKSIWCMRKMAPGSWLCQIENSTCWDWLSIYWNVSGYCIEVGSEQSYWLLRFRLLIVFYWSLKEKNKAVQLLASNVVVIRQQMTSRDIVAIKKSLNFNSHFSNLNYPSPSRQALLYKVANVLN